MGAIECLEIDVTRVTSSTPTLASDGDVDVVASVVASAMKP